MQLLEVRRDVGGNYTSYESVEVDTVIESSY